MTVSKNVKLQGSQKHWDSFDSIPQIDHFQLGQWFKRLTLLLSSHCTLCVRREGPLAALNLKCTVCLHLGSKGPIVHVELEQVIGVPFFPGSRYPEEVNLSVFRSLNSPFFACFSRFSSFLSRTLLVLSVMGGTACPKASNRRRSSSSVRPAAAIALKNETSYNRIPSNTQLLCPLDKWC